MRSTPFLSAFAAVTLVPSRNVNPCLARIRSKPRLTSRSIVGRIVSRNSTTVTLAPSRAQTLPSSSPMTPPPMTTRCPGTASSSSAPVEVTMRFSSTSTPFSGMLSLPVAMTICFVS